MADHAFHLLNDDGFILDGALPHRMPPSAAPAAASAAAKAAAVTTAPVQQLHPNPSQPRRRFPEESLRALAASMQRNGLLQPILVRPHGQHAGEFEIVAGERRWRAARLAGLAEVPIVLRRLSDREALEYALVENLQREELTPLEKADSYRRLIEEFDRTPEQLARNLGKSRSHVVNTLRLLTLPPAVQEMLQEGDITAGHARALLGTDRPEDAAREVVARCLSVRQTERLAQQGRLGAARDVSPSSRRSRTAVLERSLCAMLGLKISLSVNGDGGGTLTIHYDGLTELDAILRRLQGAPVQDPSACSGNSVARLPGPVIEHQADDAPGSNNMLVECPA